MCVSVCVCVCVGGNLIREREKFIMLRSQVLTEAIREKCRVKRRLYLHTHALYVLQYALFLQVGSFFT